MKPNKSENAKCKREGDDKLPAEPDKVAPWR